jgi:phosphoribosylamine--glycine ligase
VPDGYPTDPEAGAAVAIDDDVVDAVAADHAEAGGEGVEAILFYASVDERDDGIYTTTSRSFAVVGVAGSIAEAEEIAEEALERAGTEGLRVRHDVGKPELVEQRIEHVRQLHEAE